MTIKRFSRVLGVATGLAIMTLSPSLAVAKQQSGSEREQVQGERAQAGRVAGSRASQRRQRQQAAPAAPDPAVVKAEVEAVLASASVTCQVTDSKFMGSTAEQVKLYETACATGPGYILVASTPPQAVDCVVLHSQAEAARTRDPAAPPSQVCTLPGNQDVMGVMKAYAAEAGVACTVDEMAVRGQTSSGVVVYEVGCVGVDGFRIQKAAEGWEKTECLQVLQQNATCAFTTPAEQAATVKSWLAGSAAGDCDVQQVRLMGQNANGRFYEAACAAGNGFIARTNAEHAVQQIYPCAEAEKIGDGCKLTTTPPAATPQA